MNPATAPRDDRAGARLLLLDPRTGAHVDARVRDLPRWLGAGDLLIVNDAATLPASLRARAWRKEHVSGDMSNAELDDGAGSRGWPKRHVSEDMLSADLEVRLTGVGGATWRAALLGAGDWRTPTERRPPPPALRVGDRLVFSEALTAAVVGVSPVSPRLCELRFDREGAALWAALYRLGRPVQYAHVREPLALWSVQTVFAARPWAAEMPSAGRPLDWDTLLALRRAGVEIAAVTHAAGLSSTGDPELDAALPLAERFEVPAATVAAIARVRAGGGRVIAVGTTVVRALEGSVRRFGGLQAGSGETDLVLGPGFVPRVVDGIVTGMHGPGESHFALLQAFAGEAALRAAFEHAIGAGYLAHEFGDAALIVPGLLPPVARAA
ncbi:S-adenosylmethionine:tRNA ribosyltransferase-isomerase [Nannocystis bainbridge]|uniref:S-adenosylmethionine:tRNA ribosyltransferase-isomerase n=1 Tax=Nannocystis bainbridge TaxID=2995303 RepID=A0ABT5DS98_9BACT|nr:S-adenosylmethionine:tRNA ribosyltransferase-isomerase [Nannocystis bainbridge]MDC0716008.1 S-adenosylmethionine:tRNA ribosyltransferase-isomerase [Nannocystis bainbridge]